MKDSQWTLTTNKWIMNIKCHLLNQVMKCEGQLYQDIWLNRAKDPKKVKDSGIMNQQEM